MKRGELLTVKAEATRSLRGRSHGETRPERLAKRLRKLREILAKMMRKVREKVGSGKIGIEMKLDNRV